MLCSSLALALGVVLSSSPACSAGTASEAPWRTYRDDANGFEFRFPTSMKFEARFGSGELKDTQTGRTILRTEVWPPDECTHARGEKTVTSAREVALRRADDRCRADGANGSSFCTDPVTVRAFTSEPGAKGFEIHLTRAREYCDEDEKGDCVGPVRLEVYGRKGPVYAFDLSTDTPTKVLYVEPAGVDPAVSSPERRGDLRVIREVLSTLRVFEVGSRPEATCIQDLPPGRGFAIPLRPSPAKPR